MNNTFKNVIFRSSNLLIIVTLFVSISLSGCDQNNPKFGRFSLENLPDDTDITVFFFSDNIIDELSKYKNQFEILELANMSNEHVLYDIREAVNLKIAISDINKAKLAVDSEWKNHIASLKNNYNSELLSLENDLLEFKEKELLINELIREPKDIKESLEKEINDKKEYISKLKKDAISYINEIIIEKSIPVKILNKNSDPFKYRYYNNPKKKDCIKLCAKYNNVVPYDRYTFKKNLCHCLNIPDNRLFDVADFKDIYTIMFEEYQTSLEELGTRNYKTPDTLYYKLNEAKIKLDNATIVASNKFGNISKFSRDVSRAEREIEKLKNKLSTLEQKSEKEKFAKNYLNKNISLYRDKYHEYVNAIVKTIFALSHSKVNVKSGDTFDIPPNTSYIVAKTAPVSFSMLFKEQPQYSIFSISSISNDKDVLSISEDEFNFFGSPAPDSLYSFLRDRTLWLHK